MASKFVPPYDASRAKLLIKFAFAATRYEAYRRAFSRAEGQMLRLSKTYLLLFAAAALTFSPPATSRGVSAEFGKKIDEAEKQLDAEIKAGKPIDVSKYERLEKEVSDFQASFNQTPPYSSANVPSDVTSDAVTAWELLDRAKEAAKKFGTASASQISASAPAVPPTPHQAQAARPASPGSPDFGSRVAAAERELEADIKACRPIDVSKYEQLEKEVSDFQASFNQTPPYSSANVPADVTSAAIGAWELLERAKEAAKKCRTASAPQIPGPGAAVSPTLPQMPAINLPSWARQILAAHNAERATVGAPPLKWNEELAQHATQYAQELARTGQLVHAPREGRGTERENLQKGLIGWSPERMIQDWAKEKGNFAPGNFPDVARDGNWLNVAHYTQMIWPTTTDIGCGYAPGGGFNWLVCRYNPGGNKDGKWVGQQQVQIARGGQTEVDQAPALDETERSTGGRVDYDELVKVPVAADIVNGVRVRRDWGSQQITEQARRDAGLDADPVPSFGVDVDMVNKYIWRGYTLNDDPSGQPNVWMTAYGFAASAWLQFAVNQLTDPLGLDMADDEPVCRFHQLEPSVSASYDLGLNALKKYNYPVFDSSLEERAPKDRLWFWGSGNYQKIEGSDDVPLDTKVEQPDLGGLPEVYDPNAKYKDPNSPPCEM
jgi:Cysteine-rich secretory protein family